MAVREVARHVVGVLQHADVVEQLDRALLDFALLATFGRRLEHRAEQPVLGAHVAPHHHVLERGHAAEQPNVLERARDPRLRDLMHRGRGVVLAVEFEVAGVGRVEPGDHVEERSLARAVRADQAVDLPFLDLGADVGQRLQAAEALVHAFHGQSNVVAHCIALPHAVRYARTGFLPPRFASFAILYSCFGAGHRPSELYSMMTNIARP